MRLEMKIIFFMGFLLLMLPGSINARIYTLANSGGDFSCADMPLRSWDLGEGDILKISSSNPPQCSIQLFEVTGRSGSPVKVTHDGGQVTLTRATTRPNRIMIYLSRCKYITLDGSGVPGKTHGIVLDGSRDKATYGFKDWNTADPDGIVIKNIEIKNVKVGFSEQGTKSSENATGWEIGYCYFHEILNEAIYFGKTTKNNWTKFTAKIHHNKIENCGWDGIQINNHINTRVYNNVLNNIGTSSQKKSGNAQSGISIGRRSTGIDIYYNTISNVPKSIVINGKRSTGKVRSNHIYNIAKSPKGSTEVGIWGMRAGASMIIEYNQVVADGGFAHYGIASTSRNIIVRNNIAIGHPKKSKNISCTKGTCYSNTIQ